MYVCACVCVCARVRVCVCVLIGNVAKSMATSNRKQSTFKNEPMQLFQQKAANPNADGLQQQQKREEVTHTQKKTCSSHGFYMSTTRTATQ